MTDYTNLSQKDLVNSIKDLTEEFTRRHKEKLRRIQEGTYEPSAEELLEQLKQDSEAKAQRMFKFPFWEGHEDEKPLRPFTLIAPQARGRDYLPPPPEIGALVLADIANGWWRVTKAEIDPADGYIYVTYEKASWDVQKAMDEK